MSFKENTYQQLSLTDSFSGNKKHWKNPGQRFLPMKYFPLLMKIGSLYCIAIRHQDQIHRLRMDVQEEKTVMVADGAYSGFDVLQGINPGAVLL